MLANPASQHPEMFGLQPQHSHLNNQQHHGQLNRHSNHASISPFTAQQQQQQYQYTRKRKADTPPENNERLSKRMSRLHLGLSSLRSAPSPPVSIRCSTHFRLTPSIQADPTNHKIYVPVENLDSTAPAAATAAPSNVTTNARTSAPSTSITNDAVAKSTASKHHAKTAPTRSNVIDDQMHLDDTKYKVYIYNLEEELASDTESESDNNANSEKLFLSEDMQKQLRQAAQAVAAANRIPPSVTPRREPESAGKELVLYRVPSSLTVPQEQDSVRRAIAEARARLREKQKEKERPKKEEEVVEEVVISKVGSLGAGAGKASVSQPMEVSMSDMSDIAEDDGDAMELD